MNWLLVARSLRAADGGIAAATALFLRAAARAGWSIEVLTERPAPVPSSVRVTVVRQGREPRSARRATARLRQTGVIRPYRFGRWSLAVARELAARTRHVDAIEFSDAMAPAFVSVSSSTVRDRLPGARFIVHAHTPLWLEDDINGVPDDVFGRPLYHAWERHALARADAVITVSRGLAERLRVLDAPIAPYPLHALRRAPRVTRPASSVVFIGSLQPRKGVDVLLDAAVGILRRRSDLRFDIIGPDTTATPRGASVRAALAARLPADVAPRVLFHGARRPAAVRHAIAGARLVVVPSRFESFGLAAAEAVILGTPVVVSSACGLLEWIEPAHCPRTVEPGDVGALERAVEEELEGPPLAAERRATRAALLSACMPARALEVRARVVADSGARPATVADELRVMPARLARLLRPAVHPRTTPRPVPECTTAPARAAAPRTHHSTR